jgi:hypothetical protein
MTVAKNTRATEQTTVAVDADTLARLLAVAQLFDIGSVEQTLAAIVERFHAAHLGGAGRLPDGWRLREDLSLSDLENYYAAYDAEAKPVSTWHERGRTIRAAVTAGWFDAPGGLTADDVGGLRPAQAPAIKAAIDELYLRLTTADPNW